MSAAYVVDAIRSPIGRRHGSLADVRADDLAAQVLNGLVERLDVDPGEIEDVQMGCVTQIGEQALNVGRVALLAAGWPETVAASTIDRQCGSSLQAAFNAAAAIEAGHLDVVVAAGVESMSRVPMGSNLGAEGFAGLNPKIAERWPIVPQGISAEAIASEWKLSREALDEYSLESHRRAIAATDEGRFEREIVPIEVLADAGETSRIPQTPFPGPLTRTGRSAVAEVAGSAAGAAVLFAVDEAARRDTTAEKLAALPPAFTQDGVVTAGNSSSIVDGAAAMLVASEAAVQRLGVEPRARFVSFGLAGVDPYRMLHGNPQACERALAKAGLGWDDMAVIEVNEAFAAVVLQFLADTGLHERWEAGDVNPNGGGISLGHPLGATGARITATLVNELDRRGARYGIASMCIGQGQAIAAVLERL
jgi:acetyl-CoA acetyltransferase family protein